MSNKLKTKCLKCEKEFDLELSTVWAKMSMYDSFDLEVVIECPHCKARYEY